MEITDEQFIEAYNKHNGVMKEIHKYLSNKYFKLNLSTVYRRSHRLKNKGLLPLESGVTVESGTILKGISRYHKLEDGGVWVKSDVEKTNALEAFEQAIIRLSESTVPKKRAPVPVIHNDSLLTVYTVGDAHIGMLSHKAETGSDNDLKIIEMNLLTAMEMLVTSVTKSDECLIIDVGDWFHSDNQNNTTAKSNNKLDVDGRYHKVLDVGLRLITELIDRALQKHLTVRWRSASGNHNEHAAIMATAFVKAYYRNEPRVIVHDTPNAFMYHQFGKNLIGVTHGHTVKADKLGEIMSVDCEEIWSSTKNRFWYTGHVHHLSTKEYPSCVVETFRTLAGKDAWHSASGYRSGQDMKAITLHKDFGEVSRSTVNLAAIQSTQKELNGN